MSFMFQKKLYSLYAFVVQLKKLYALLYVLYAFVVQKKTLCSLCFCESIKKTLML